MLYCSFVFYPKWQQKDTEATISWDASGYYWYLPSLFIYHDLKNQAFKDSILHKYAPTPGLDFQQAMHQPDGGYVMKYSSGVALMETPFFLCGHLAAGWLGYPQDGFSPPYQLAIQIGGVFIALLGLWYFRKFLLLFYSDRVTAVSLLLLVFGTNYLNYAAIDTAMSHNWLFTVYVLLLWSTCKFYRRPALKYAIGIGLLTGLATLTRPTDIIACIIPLLWGMESVSFKAIKERLAFFRDQYGRLFAAAVCAGIVIAIQPIYWKTVSGHWLIYSYGDQGFSWKHPHVYRYAFDVWNGWLAYTPLMILAVIGGLPYLKYGRNKVMVVTFSIVCYYIVSAWDIWWYGGRAMVQYYPVLVLSVACLLQWLEEHRVWKWVLTPFVLLFVYINLWWTYQAHAGKFYDGSQVTSTYYWRTIGRFSAPADIAKLKDTDEWFDGEPVSKTLLYSDDLRQDTAGVETDAPDTTGKIFLDSFKWNSQPYKWLRASIIAHCFSKEWDVWRMTEFHVRFKNGNRVVKDRFIRLQRLLNDNETREIFFDVKIPAEPFDHVETGLYNKGSDKPAAADTLRVWGIK